MNKKLMAGMGVALAAGVIMGATVLGGAFASPKAGAPASTSPAVEKTTSGSAIIMQATPVKDGQLPVLDANDVNMQVVKGAGTVIVSSDGHVVSATAADAIPAGAVTGTATILPPDGKLPVIDPNDPNLHVIQAGSTVTLNADGTVSTSK